MAGDPIALTIDGYESAKDIAETAERPMILTMLVGNDDEDWSVFR